MSRQCFNKFSVGRKLILYGKKLVSWTAGNFTEKTGERENKLLSQLLQTNSRRVAQGY